MDLLNSSVPREPNPPGTMIPWQSARRRAALEGSSVVVSIHLSCTLHMSQPPVTRERRVVYTDFSLNDSDDDPGEKLIARVREQAYKTVSQEPAPS